MIDFQLPPVEEREITNRMTDTFFKFLMGEEDSKPLLLELINNTILEGQPKGKLWYVGGKKYYSPPSFKSLEIKNLEKVAKHEDGKRFVLDILATMDDGTMVNVELQNRVTKDTFSRFAKYTHRLSAEDLESGEDYTAARPIISIILSNGTPLADNERYVSMYATMDVDDHTLRTSDILYYEVELKKFNATHYRRLRKLVAIVQYLKSGKIAQEQWDELIRIVPALAIAKTKEEAFVIDNKQYSNYIQDREAEYLYKSDIREAEERGREQGLERGRQQEKHSMVQSLLDQGVDDSIISTASGLSVEEIKALRKNDSVIFYKHYRDCNKIG